MAASRIETYKDHAGEHRWRLRAGNNRIVAVAGEGFTRPADAVRAVADARHAFADLPTAIMDLGELEVLPPVERPTDDEGKG